VVHSEKDKDGNWSEFSKTVTTVVERDDEGWPYGPIRYGLNPFSFGGRKGGYGDYLAWYDELSAWSAKKDKKGKEDGQNA
jgi:hypothetical protein